MSDKNNKKNTAIETTAESALANSAANPFDNEVITKLIESGLDRTAAQKIMVDLGIESLEDLASLEVTDLTGAGMKLAKARKYVLLVIAVVAAVLTPPDVVSQCMLGLPMYLLYEIATQLARFVKPVSQRSTEKA